MGPGGERSHSLRVAGPSARLAEDQTCPLANAAVRKALLRRHLAAIAEDALRATISATSLARDRVALEAEDERRRRCGERSDGQDD